MPVPIYPLMNVIYLTHQLTVSTLRNTKVFCIPNLKITITTKSWKFKEVRTHLLSLCQDDCFRGKMTATKTQQNKMKAHWVPAARLLIKYFHSNVYLLWSRISLLENKNNPKIQEGPYAQEVNFDFTYHRKMAKNGKELTNSKCTERHIT